MSIGSITLHTDGYKTITSGASHTQTLAALADKNLYDTHSSSWSWEKGVGGSASKTGTNTMKDDFAFTHVNQEVTGGITYSSTMISTSHDETTTDERRTYTVPVTLSTSTGAANQA